MGVGEAMCCAQGSKAFWRFCAAAFCTVLCFVFGLFRASHTDVGAVWNEEHNM